MEQKSWNIFLPRGFEPWTLCWQSSMLSTRLLCTIQSAFQILKLQTKYITCKSPTSTSLPIDRLHKILLSNETLQPLQDTTASAPLTYEVSLADNWNHNLQRKYQYKSRTCVSRKRQANAYKLKMKGKLRGTLSLLTSQRGMGWILKPWTTCHCNL